MKALFLTLILLIQVVPALCQTDAYAAYLELTKKVAEVSAAGKHDQSAALARALLKSNADYPTDWNYGNALHVGHLALGRSALAAGDIHEAEKQLLLSVDRKGLPYGMELIRRSDDTAIERPRWKASPVMDSFGPDMVLAKELLLRGDTEAVIKYFDLCAAFWMHTEKLAAWRVTVQQGGVPDFGPNLIYFFPDMKGGTK